MILSPKRRPVLLAILALVAASLVAGIAASVSTGVFIFPMSALAGVGDTTRGFIWGGSETSPDATMNGNETGPGWISMNSVDCDVDHNGFVDAGACGGNNSTTVAYNYGVTIPPSDGPLSGYAWSPYFGWVSFNGADLGGTNPCTPTLSQATRTGNNITGGARILSIRDQTSSSVGRWDGCINLSSPGGSQTVTTTNYQWSCATFGGAVQPTTDCTASNVGTTVNVTNGSCTCSSVTNQTTVTSPAYGVSIVNNNALSGYAWSSDLGWLDMSGVVYQPAIPVVTFSANPSTISKGQSSTLTWSSTGATSCTSAGGFSTGGATSGSASVSPTTTSTYSITCSGTGGSSPPASATVTVIVPTLSITATPNRVVSGGSTSVTWNATNVKNCAVGRNGIPWKTLSANASGVVSGSSSDTITSQTTYALSCNDVNSVAVATAASIVVNISPNFKEY